MVRYNAEENKQKSFFKASRAVACIAVSEDGSLLAVGERGHQPAVSVWDVHANTKIATLTAHKHGVGCLAFSPNGEYLVSVGFKHDKQLVLWDWNNEKKLTTQKLGNKVHSVSFHPSGDFFVTCGDRHLKWWAVMEILDGEAVSLEGKAASIIEDLRTSTFMDVVCGQEDLDSWVFTVSSVGNLCLFNEKKMVEKWIQLDSSTSYCLEVFCAQGTPGLLVIGCSNGVVKCYNPSTLEHIATIPLPAPLIQGNNLAETLPNKAYGACYALRKVAGTKASPVPKLAAIYSDHSLFVWDIEDIFNVVKYRSFVYHRACVWDVLFLENLEDSEELSPISSDSPIDSGSRTSSKKSKLPTGSFITCSADNTIKIWNTDPKAQRTSKFRSVYSREMLCNIDLFPEDDGDLNSSTLTDNNQSNLSAMASTASGVSMFTAAAGSGCQVDLSCGIQDSELPDRPQSSYSPRSLAIHPLGSQLACGDRTGRLRVYDLRTASLVQSTRAHAAEILTLNYSPPLVSVDGGENWTASTSAEEVPTSAPMVLLASAGRDRLVHIYDATANYSNINTLDNHSSSVTVAKFTSDGRRLVSCGGDKTMVFNSVNGRQICRMKSLQTPHGTINGLAIEATNKFAVSSGQDKKLNIWNVQIGKHLRAYKSESITSELYKCDIDPSGNFIFIQLHLFIDNSKQIVRNVYCCVWIRQNDRDLRLLLW